MICLLLFRSTSIAQTNSDTIFLQRDTLDGYYHSVFIEPDSQSEIYNYFESLNFSYFDSTLYQEYISMLLDSNPEPFLHFKYDRKFPLLWDALHSHDSKLYLYAPCDWLYDYKLKITDSTFELISGEGPEPSRILSYQKLSNHNFQFVVEPPAGDSMIYNFHLLKSLPSVVRMICYYNRNSEPTYMLFADAKKARSFPLIVNKCDYRKMAEYKFDEPDWKKFL